MTRQVRELKMLGYQIQDGQISPDPDILKPLLEMQPPANIKGNEKGSGIVCLLCQVDSKLFNKD